MLVANPPTHCACCRKKLDYSTGRGLDKRDSPSLDRWDNSQGYTLENTKVICYRCNELKRDATLAEMKVIVRYMMPKRKRKRKRKLTHAEKAKRNGCGGYCENPDNCSGGCYEY